MEQKDRIIVEVAWVADDGLIVKEIDRAARMGQVVVFTGARPRARSPASSARTARRRRRLDC
jgi:dipeptidyl aminopeptidase